MAENGGNGVSRWQLWASLATVAVLVTGSLVSLYVQVSSAYTTANDTKERLDRLSSMVELQRTQITQLCSALVETETQFKSADQTRNVMHANELRIDAMLWQKTFRATFPTDNAYYPTIAQDEPSPCH